MLNDAGLRADPAAEELAQQMVRAEHTMHTILSETVDPVKGEIMESGRTVCGNLSSVKGPLKRFPAAVDLSSCPRGVSGTWHSHVTQDQILRPEHSLPDMANVAFGHIDVSVVVGSEASDVLVAAEDKERMKEVYQNALGIEVESTREVVQALDDGRLPDPPAHRSRVRTQFGSLFRQKRTPYPEITSEVRSLTDAGAISARAPDDSADIEPMYASAYLIQTGHDGGSSTHCDRLRQKARRVNSSMPQMGRQVGGTVANSAVGLMTRRALERFI